MAHYAKVSAGKVTKVIVADQAFIDSIKIDNEEIEFSEGFTDLHNLSYQQIINGNGYTLTDVEPTIKLIEEIRYANSSYTTS